MSFPRSSNFDKVMNEVKSHKKLIEISEAFGTTWGMIEKKYI